MDDGQTPEERRPGYIAVLPASVRYDPALSSTAKLIFAEISALSESYGYAWCSNDYLERLFGLSERQVIRLLGKLVEFGYLRIEGSGTTKRKMWCNLNPRELQEWQDAERRIAAPATDKNVSATDKNVSATDKNVSANYIVKKKLQKETNPPKAPRGGKSVPSWKPERFAGLWQYYPRKTSKQAAVKAWDKLRPSDELIANIGKALRRQKASDDWQRGIGIPYLSTYLNNARWEDEPDAPLDDEPVPTGRKDLVQL